MVNIILVLLAVFLWSQISYIFQDIVDTLLMLVGPIVISLFPYYWLRPITRRLSTGKNMKYRTLVSILTLLVLIGIIFGVISIGGVVISKQFKDVFIDSGGNLSKYRDMIINNISKLNLNNDIMLKISRAIENTMNKIGGSMINIFSGIGDFTTQLILIPFIVFYMLKDEEKLFKSLESLIPKNKKQDLIPLGAKIDNVLSNYITGQLFVALIIGSLMFIGYLILKVPNALLMATMAVITSIIPIIGAFLGVLPAILMALTVDIALAIKIVILAIIVQQLEGDLITPNLMGSKLDIHPLTVMIVIIVSINLMGIFGAFIGIPLYLILNLSIRHIFSRKTDME